MVHITAKKGLTEITQMLITKGAKIDATDALGMTPLYLAVSKGSQPIVEIFIKHDANLEAECGPHLRTPLHITAKKGLT